MPKLLPCQRLISLLPFLISSFPFFISHFLVPTFSSALYQAPTPLFTQHRLKDKVLLYQLQCTSTTECFFSRPYACEDAQSTSLCTGTFGITPAVTINLYIHSWILIFTVTGALWFIQLFWIPLVWVCAPTSLHKWHHEVEGLICIYGC